VCNSPRGSILLTRRELFATASAAIAVGGALGAEPTARPKIAAIVTEYRKASHGQGIVDRFLDGYGWEGRHYRPGVDVVALYVDQKPEGDLSRERLERHPSLSLYPTIAAALTRGGKELAVEGVLIIGEHGRYPRNEKGQTLYPRYEFFQQVVEVFRKNGRSVPVFNDKHLSWRWDWAKEMVDTAKAMGFPLLAGSSLPVTWRIPSVEMPLGAEIEEAVCVCFGGVDSYDFHGLETIQCMVERRRGGETGVAAVQAIRGINVWRALRAGSWDAGGFDRGLFEACLCRSFTLTSPRAGYGNAFPDLDDLPAMVPDPIAYRIEYADGLKATMLLMNGLVGDFTFAARLKDRPEPLSTQFYLPGFAPNQTLPNFFSALAHHVETLFTTGRAPYPVERTLLTTGLVAAGVDSLAAGQARIETPHLAVRYEPPREPLYWRS
jgi:hypothetical protein